MQDLEAASVHPHPKYRAATQRSAGSRRAVEQPVASERQATDGAPPFEHRIERVKWVIHSAALGDAEHSAGIVRTPADERAVEHVADLEQAAEWRVWLAVEAFE